MKIVVTGSLGNVSKPLTEKLEQKGHSITVISSNPERKKDIEAVGAKVAVGKLEDAGFLASTFTGADAVYCMIPISFKVTDLIAYFNEIGNNYATAIQKAGVKRLVALSGWVAGIIDSDDNVENIFNKLPDVSITLVRPGYFYSNFFDSINMIKEKGLIAATFGGEDKIVFSAPSDIADAVAEELSHPHHGRKIRYVASDEMSCNEAAAILGTAIGKPDLKWITMTDEDMKRELEKAGLSSKLSSDLVEMQVPIHKGLMPREFSRHSSEVVPGKVKLTDFAKEFSDVYNKK